MVIMNCDGDFAIIKGKWSAFQKRVQPSKGLRLNKPLLLFDCL